MINKARFRNIFLGLACIVLCASAPGQTLPNLSGAWTGQRTETGDIGDMPANSNQVLTLYQLGSGGSVIGTLSTYWPGTAYYWGAVASGTLSGKALTLTWTIIPSTVNLAPGHVACSETLSLTLSTANDFTTAAVPSYHPCGSGNTVEPYTLTLVGWQKMLGHDDSGGTSCSWFCGDPIDIATGNVLETVKDYETAGPNKLSLIRYYNSYQPPPSPPGVPAFRLFNASNWTTNYDRSLELNSAGTQVIASRPDGELLPFNLTGGVWKPDTDVDMTLTSSGNTWTLTGPDDTAEMYTTVTVIGQIKIGQLNAIVARNGYTQTLAYNGSNQIESVTDSYGRQLIFSYTAGLLTQARTPDTLVLSYSYNSSGQFTVNDRLASVSYNTSPVTSQNYNYPDGSLQLSSITDENGNTYAGFVYDGYGRAVSSQHAGGADLTTLTYNDSAGTRTVTNALGQQSTYTFVSLQGTNKVAQISRKADAPVAAATSSFTYDSNGFTASATDWNGRKTTYVNDVHGMPTTINEAVGTSVARTTTISYNSTWVHLPATITTPGLTTSFTYDSKGEVLTRTLTDTTTTTAPYSTKGETRTWTNTWSNSLLSSVKTPNGNTTKYGHDNSGALTSTTDAKGHITKITSHTGGGLPEIIVDPNGVTTTQAYEPRNWLTSSTVSGTGGTYSTGWGYDKAGNLIKTTLPDNSYLENTYDDAHRLIKVTDALGNYTTYTLDALGDRTQTDVYEDGGTLTRKRSDTFDSLGRLLVDTAGAGQTTTFTHDSNGNVLSVTDGLKHKTTNTYDALNRLSTTTDANAGVTTTAYDAHDRVISVKDADGHTTSYVRDGFGGVIGQTSPDSGQTVFHYDADANLISKTDALTIITNQTFDALDRPLTTTYPADSSKNVAYTYDQTGTGFSFGIGRLTRVTDAAGSLTRAYDERGNLSTEKRVNGTKTLTTSYTYDGASRVATITYPDGTLVQNHRNTAGYLSGVSAIPLGSKSSTTLASISHLPFGPVNSVTYGNGIAETWAYDEDYRATAITDVRSGKNLQELTYAYDAANNVHTITDAINAANSQTLGYDLINRLTSAISGTGGYGSYAWTYDKVSNRLTQKSGSTTTNYGYTSGTNRLASITVGGVETTVSTNADGNITSIPPANSTAPATFAYSVANRLASVTGSPMAATFDYDWAGQRFSKTDNGSPSITYSYMPGGTLLAENDNGVLTDYIYADGRPIAVLHPGATPAADQVSYIVADRLGTPQLASNSSGATVWTTTYQPFGTTGMVTASIVQDLRFPGQNMDVETGFSYNLNRDYMPSLGRYLESDPIGLAGGVNTYLYANTNPGKFTDATGTCLEDFCIGEIVFIYEVVTASDEIVVVGESAAGLGESAIAATGSLYSSAQVTWGNFFSTPAGAAILGFSATLLGELANTDGVIPENLLEGLVGEGQQVYANGFQFLGQIIGLLDQMYEYSERLLDTGETMGTGLNNSGSQRNCNSFGNDFGDSFSSSPNLL